MNLQRQYETLLLNQQVIMTVLIFLLEDSGESVLAGRLDRYLAKLIKETGLDAHLEEFE